ncbi:MAG: hypothetical protein ACK51V_00790 [bacterium]
MAEARAVRRVTVLALALAATACAPVRPLPPTADHAPTVTLPLGLSGVADERRAFAAVFERELRAEGRAASAAPWLHGPAPASDGRMEGLSARFSARAGGVSVLILPGLFGDCFDTQSVPYGDGQVRSREHSLTEAYRQYADLGLLGLRALSLPGRVSSAANAPRVAAALQAEAARPEVQRIVILAYSKGVPDALRALAHLQHLQGIPAKVTDLVSVAGPVMGTALADQAERAYSAISPRVSPFDCSPSEGQELASLTRRESVAWFEHNPLPPGLRYHSVVAHVARQDVGPGLRAFHAFLSTFDGRNDGQVMASDAVIPGSTLLAEARADHWDVALPRDRHPDAWMRSLSSGRAYPREALFRAMLKWVIANGH